MCLVHSCNSYLGMRMTSGSQDVNVADRCSLGGVQHELIHALGFEHEHQRPDRDKYIRVIYDNIVPGLSINQAPFLITTNTPRTSTTIRRYELRCFNIWRTVRF